MTDHSIHRKQQRTILEVIQVLYPLLLTKGYTSNVYRDSSVKQYPRISINHIIPEAWIKELGFRDFLRGFFMHCFELFSLLGTDICLECWHMMLQLNCLTSLHIDRSTLGVQDHWCCPEHDTVFCSCQ